MNFAYFLIAGLTAASATVPPAAEAQELESYCWMLHSAPLATQPTLTTSAIGKINYRVELEDGKARLNQGFKVFMETLGVPRQWYRSDVHGKSSWCESFPDRATAERSLDAKVKRLSGIGVKSAIGVKWMPLVQYPSAFIAHVRSDLQWELR